MREARVGLLLVVGLLAPSFGAAELTEAERRHYVEKFRLEAEAKQQAHAAAGAMVEEGRPQAEALIARVGERLTIPEMELALILIRPGVFTMGSEQGEKDEKPNTVVALTRPYWLGATEVTQRQWDLVMGGNRSPRKDPARPVWHVTHDEAVEFCRRLTARERQAGRLPEGCVYTLPTEAQWEYACRAGHLGDVPCEMAWHGWFAEAMLIDPAKVGTKPPNDWGLYDMWGNVGEWCRDWYGDYPGGTVRDPVGAPSGLLRAIRGGCGQDDSRQGWSTIRRSARPYARDLLVGLSLVLEAERR